MTNSRPCPPPLSLPLLLLCIFGTAACGTTSRLLPPGGQIAATGRNEAARLSVYQVPPLQAPQTPLLRGTTLLFIELRNNGDRTLRIDYGDIYLSDVSGARRVPALRPGQVFRLSALSPGQRRLFASAQPDLFLQDRRKARALPGGVTEPSGTPSWLSDSVHQGVLLPEPRYRTNNLWIMQTNHGTGPQINAESFPLFGLPTNGQNMSLFDLLASTLPDGALPPGQAVSGFLFFPTTALPAKDAQLQWTPRETFSDRLYPPIRVPVSPAP